MIRQVHTLVLNARVRRDICYYEEKLESRLELGWRVHFWRRSSYLSVPRYTIMRSTLFQKLIASA